MATLTGTHSYEPPSKMPGPPGRLLPPGASVVRGPRRRVPRGEGPPQREPWGHQVRDPPRDLGDLVRPTGLLKQLQTDPKRNNIYYVVF